MNRKQRRSRERSLRKVDYALRSVMEKSENDGKPWCIKGMTGACSDCGAAASLHGQGQRGRVVAHIYHDEGCPAGRGVVEWKPVPL